MKSQRFLPPSIDIVLYAKYTGTMTNPQPTRNFAQHRYPAGAARPREKVTFETNVPETVALEFDDGLDVQGRFGDQVLYSLTDDRVMYVPPIVRDRIRAAGIARGETFIVTKAEVRRGNRRGIEWRVERPDETLLEQQLRESIDHVQNQEPSRPPAKANGTAPQAPGPSDEVPDAHQSTPPVNGKGTDLRPRTKLEDALCTVVVACHSAQAFAARIGFQMPPADFESISKMAMTLVIEGRNGR